MQESTSVTPMPPRLQLLLDSSLILSVLQDVAVEPQASLKNAWIRGKQKATTSSVARLTETHCARQLFVFSLEGPKQ